MATTECIIDIDLVDVTAKEDSAPIVYNNNAIADSSHLKEGNYYANDYMTLEWNYALLDGTMDPVFENINESDYTIISNGLSDSAGALENEPYIIVDFKERHSSIGITVNFVKDCPKTISITWIGENNKILSEKEFMPDNANYFCENVVENYVQLKIYFDDTAFPYRYIKINNIQFGATLSYSGRELVSANLLEEIDPISSSISINKLTFSMFDKEGLFNSVNINGYLKLLQKKQEIRVREEKDGSTIELGTFYLDDWSAESELKPDFTAIDAIGLLDKTSFKKGRIYEKTRAGVIIDEIMSSAGWTKYTMPQDLKNIELSGYIGVCTHRQALQQVAFALRTVIDCSRSDYIKIYRLNYGFDKKINYDRQFMSGGNVNTRQRATNLQITMHKRVRKTESSKLYEGYLQQGLSEIIFNNPADGLAIQNGTIVESGLNYAIVKTDELKQCVLQGHEYEDRKITYSYDIAGGLNGNEMPVTKEIKDATLVSENNIYLLSEYLFNYYELAHKVTARYLIDTEKVGECIALRSYMDLFIVGFIEKQEIDLTGGFIATVTVTGYSTYDSEKFFTGKEIYTGERLGVI